jgi:quercetin dioxygenase-like cupin family protein
MNINAELTFTPNKPAIVSILKNEVRQVFAVGLLKDQVLPKHKTAVPALLIVQEGSIEFHMNGLVTPLKRFDTFTIPVEVEHEVIGKEEKNVFLIIK